MPNHLKKQSFSIAFDRLFTRQDYDALDLIHFAEAESHDDETTPALECPDNWSSVAAEVMAEQAASLSIPAQLKAVEENTVPSWLWRHVAGGKDTQSETSVQQIFTRVVGAAAYKGWKQDLFGDENQARNFYDEARYALTQRFIAIEPKVLGSYGVDWAYGLKAEKRDNAQSAQTQYQRVELSNHTIDALVGGHTHTKWQKLLAPKHSTMSVAVNFTDVATDWGTGTNNAATAVLDLMAFRHNDGSVNIDALRHATRLLVVLLDLHDAPASIGFVNLAPLLTALAIAYDSDAGRNLAASISAVITAEAFAISAELAALRGASSDFTHNRETVLRNLRNHRRAAYGDTNDYEKLSVLPTPIDIKKSPDLALVAAAQRRFDEALELVRHYGLRHTHVTALSSSPTMAMFMESDAQGIAPQRSLTVMRREGEIFRHQISTVVIEALSRLGYDKAKSASIIQHITGHQTLATAPAIHHTILKSKGFDASALEALEYYLPNVTDIRMAFTPWVLGQDFCKKVLKISAAKIENQAFDVLQHLGFADADIAAANAFCYGQGSVSACKDLKAQHAAVFAQKNEISAEAHIRMAAAVQSFVSGAVEPSLSVADATVETNEKLLLSAWRQGLRAVNITYAEAPTRKIAAKKSKRSMSAFLHTQGRPALPTRRVTAKASHRFVSLKPALTAKSAGKNKSK